MKKRVLGLFFVLVFLIVFGAFHANAQTESYCQHCQKEVTWLPLTTDSQEGHFYVAEDQTIPQLTFRSAVCVDLRGHTLSTEGTRAFYLANSAVMSLQDSVGGGKVIGSRYGKNTLGGTVYLQAKAAFHLYSGTLTNVRWGEEAVYNGGSVCCLGRFYMYGGSIENGVCDWVGGNVYVNKGGYMTISGGSITGGKAEVAHSDCVVNRGTVTLSGDAIIDQLRLWPDGDVPPLKDSLVLDGKFSGKANLYIANAKNGMDIGNLINGGSFAPGSLSVLSQYLFPEISGGDILLRSKAAAVCDETGGEVSTDTLDQAIALAKNKTLKLLLSSDQSITVPYGLTLDLNGCSLSGLTVSDGKTVTLKDSATDDFEGTYGQIASVSGTVKAAKGYKLTTDETGAVSAHAYTLDVTAAVLRPSTTAMFFTGTFRGDDQFKASVTSYGIVMDVTGEPNFSTLNKTSKHTSFRDQFADTNGVTSVLLKNILKEENTVLDNNRNGELTVYCKPYIRFQDNTYAWGEVKAISFRQLLEKADLLWTEEAVPQELQALYNRFEETIKNWDVPNLKAAVKTGAPSPYKVYDPTTEAEINALPVATADMTTDQLRQICVDFFRMQNTFQWVSETDIRYDIRGKDAHLKAGTVYAGSPYTDTAKSGNLYMTMEFYDQETGILTNPGLTDENFMKLVGNHCTYGSYWGWARVINSMTTQWNVNMGIEEYGFIPLGDFSTAGIEKWVEGEMDTRKVRDSVEKEVILESYANVKMADFLYVWFGGGGNSHARMAAQDAVVVRNADGTINPTESYIIYLDQGSSWSDLDFNGITIPVQGGVDEKVTFAKLYSAGYLPFTFGEFIGTDPVEKSVVTSSLDGLTTVTPEQLAQATVNANYAISHVTLSVTDEAGNEVYRQSAFAPRINTLEMGIADAVNTEQLAALTGKHLTVTCRIGTGEVYTLLDGTLKAS